MAEALFSKRAGHWEVPILIVLSAATLVAGFFLPVITMKELAFWKHTFSVLTGIQSLWTGGEKGLALIIVLFSVIFPIVKLVSLSVLWFGSFPNEKRKHYLDWVAQLGRWSMLDVFVIAMTIVITKMSGLVEAKPEPGIYIFGFSVIVAMLVTMRVERLAKKTSS